MEKEFDFDQFDKFDMDSETYHNQNIIADKTMRVKLDGALQNLRKLSLTRERALAITKLQESIMWLGMDLKRLNEPNPYPNSYNPENTTVDKTADNLKL